MNIDQNRLTEQLLLQLIQNSDVTTEYVQWAEYLNIDLSISYVACLIETKNPNITSSYQEIAQIQSRISELSVPISFNQLLVLLAISDNDSTLTAQNNYFNKLFQQLDNPNIQLAIGEYFPQATNNIFLSYQSAKATLKEGKKYYPDNHIYCYKDFSLKILLNEIKPSWQKEQLNSLIQKLKKEDENGILSNTLITWFENNMQPSTTAKVLMIHRNTLEYRLNKVAQITGLNLAKITDRMLLYIALNITM
ncbi:MAG: helix-turn-helix domain-containing protein [Pasteurella sp.]|nr:helix-turn-helix domain-containing protein [Pasteurella sp.]